MSDLPGMSEATYERDRSGSWADTPRNGNDDKTVGGFTILVADDDHAIRTLTGGVLQSHGYNVLQAADGVEALEVAAQHPGPIHLLLTDISMPRLDGWALQRRMSNERPETPTIFMSGDLCPELPLHTAFLPKPFTVSGLVGKINEALRVNRGSVNFASAQRMNQATG